MVGWTFLFLNQRLEKEKCAFRPGATAYPEKHISYCSINSSGVDFLKKEKVVSRQPIFIANLKSNTMKNTVQI